MTLGVTAPQPAEQQPLCPAHCGLPRQVLTLPKNRLKSPGSVHLGACRDSWPHITHCPVSRFWDTGQSVLSGTGAPRRTLGVAPGHGEPEDESPGELGSQWVQGPEPRAATEHPPHPARPPLRLSLPPVCSNGCAHLLSPSQQTLLG